MFCDGRVPGRGKNIGGFKCLQRLMLTKIVSSIVFFLSGNGPLVAILQEALARDKVKRTRELIQALDIDQINNLDEKIKVNLRIGTARRAVKSFIQNVHHFRDEYLEDEKLPIEHVALFDEAQRAWTLAQTASFMNQKKGKPDFDKSEPEFLISCLDRHKDWAVVICLVGGGQEINTGEAGITEWIEALERSFPDWKIYISDKLSDSEYNAQEILEKIKARENVEYLKSLHLAVSMRSFRAENVSLLVKQMLDLNIAEAKNTLQGINSNYPIVITRNLSKAKQWFERKS